MTGKELPTLDELRAAGSPFGTTPPGVPKGDPAIEWQRSNPDIVVYLPPEDTYTGDNEHFLVFPSPQDDELLAVWTQSSCEGRGDNHLVFARSSDGKKWSEPQYVVGTERGKQNLQASWGFPVVARDGRIYLFYTKEGPVSDNSRQGCGTMGCLYSDDIGRSWIHGCDIPMPRVKYDHPDPQVPKNWIVWQKPIRDAKGCWFVGYTLNTSVAHYSEKLPWWHWENRAYFMRFENIDDSPAPEDLQITWLPDAEDGLTVPNPNKPEYSFASEPAPVLLPDGRLFTVMRTMTGYIWYSVSDDNGHTWRPTEVLRYRDDGDPIAHPMSPCPLYMLDNGSYILLFHNNPGVKGEHSLFTDKWSYNPLRFLRNPTYIAKGEFRPGAHQPIWFSRPKQILDTDSVPVGPKATAEIGTYTSLTEWRGQRVLWYPDRKYYLLGKLITDDILVDMRAPQA